VVAAAAAPLLSFVCVQEHREITEKDVNQCIQQTYQHERYLVSPAHRALFLQPLPERLKADLLNKKAWLKSVQSAKDSWLNTQQDNTQHDNTEDTANL